jgi:hypothetical protein
LVVMMVMHGSESRSSEAVWIWEGCTGGTNHEMWSLR